VGTWKIGSLSGARNAVKDARTAFEDLDGIESRIKASGEAAADSALEPDINNALDAAFDNFLRPMSVTMVLAGRHLFDSADSIVNLYDEADMEMGREADAATQAALNAARDDAGDVPDYSAGASTHQGPVVSQAPDPSNAERYTDGGYRW
jgi:hypothetical protein